MTKEQTAALVAKRNEAGDKYRAAVETLHAITVELAAVEMALANGHSGYAGEPIRSFGQWPDVITLRHPVFAPNVAGHWQSESTKRRDEILATITKEGKI